jgi:hypothetical protein
MNFSRGKVEGVGSMWMCRFVVFRLLVACYALCRHFVTRPKLCSCLPFSVGATLSSAAVLFGGSSKFLLLGALKHVAVSVTVRRGFCWCFPDFGVLCLVC